MKDMKQIDCRTLADRRRCACAVPVDRRTSSGRRAHEHDFPMALDAAIEQITRISTESRLGMAGDELAPYLIKNNLIGVLWSPVHLSAVLFHFQHRTQIIQSTPGASNLFDILARKFLTDYKFLAFDEMSYSRADLMLSLSQKLEAKFGIGFLESARTAGITPSESISTFVDQQWAYLKAVTGTEIPL